MKATCLFIYLLGFLLVACNQTEVKKRQLTSVLDTVNVEITPIVSEKEQTELLNTVYVKFGIAIPKYYLLEDSLPIDLNRDNLIDTLIVLSPVSLEDPDYSDCKVEIVPKRLLVEIINDNGNSKIRHSYSNLISNIGGVLSHYNGIFKTKKGFSIVHEAGARYSWSYSMEFSVENDAIALVKVLKVCSFDGNVKKVEYEYKNLPIEEINVSDTISQQCNCDKFWSELD